MSFSFNFSVGEDSDCDSIDTDKTKNESPSQNETQNMQNDHEEKEAKEIELEKTGSISDYETVTLSGNHELRVVLSDQAEKSLPQDATSSDVQQAIQANSDLLPHVYEGGMKIWECSIDLAQYLSSLQIAFRGTKILELGCGAGLPGLFAYTQGSEVTFQDYNSEVLSLITGPNILLNAPASFPACKCRMIAGDWSKVQDLLTKDQNKFDYIFTSETIYSPASYNKLHDIMSALLKPGGSIYLSAKTYYFGVGGGTRAFEEVVDKKGVFHHAVCKEYTEGVQREILKLTFKIS